MIRRVVDASARAPFAVLLVTALLTAWGWWSWRHVPLDALPAVGPTQVIVYSRWEQSPDLVEAQVTAPLVNALVGAPRVQTVRGLSDFGFSYVYVIFEDGTDLYWARARTSEYLSSVMGTLPEGAKTELGPDATALGWVFQYVVVDHTGTRGVDDLRALQDRFVRPALRAVAGVADVASVGGFTRQYDVQIDPNRLQAKGLTIGDVAAALRDGNTDVSGRVIDAGGTEFMVRGRSAARSVADLADTPLPASSGAPVRVGDVASVQLGPGPRRGVVDLDGTGDTVSGIVVMRDGQNALTVTDAVKARLASLAPGLPAGVSIEPVYDRSTLVREAVSGLEGTITEIMLTVSVVILLFLAHVPSALIPVLTVPVAVLVAFVPFRALGLSANIMSLGGIAVAMGALVDASIVVVEQTHKRLEQWQAGDRAVPAQRIVVDAIAEVAAPGFFALLIIAVSFLPVLTLEGEEGQLFGPLALSKTLAMLVGAVLAVTLDPALRVLLLRVKPLGRGPQVLRGLFNRVAVGRIRGEDEHAISRVLRRAYEPVAAWVLRHDRVVMAASVLLLVATLPVAFSLGSEFMPPLDEGTVFYMPSTVPGISTSEAQRLLQVTDALILQVPEVARVLGKAGRAETPTDPAPLSMLETLVTLKPREQWRRRSTWYSAWAPRWTLPVLRRLTDDRVTVDDIIADLDHTVSVPGLVNAWTMPVQARTTMLSSGMRSVVGLKVHGPDVQTVGEAATTLEAALKAVPGTRSVYAERAGGGYVLDVAWRRSELTRHGLSLAAAQQVVQHAIGGEQVGTLLDGAFRVPVAVRYLPDFRSDAAALARLPVPRGGDNALLTLGELADIRAVEGPAMIRNENGQPTGYVFIDVAGVDPSRYVERASAAITRGAALPTGTSVEWSGQYASMQRARQRLMVMVPLTLMLVAGLVWIATGSAVRTGMVLLAVPFSAIGAFWLLWLLGYHLSVGVWVGLIALLGVDAETGIFMLLYLELAYTSAVAAGTMRTEADLRAAILEGAVRRLRPKFMTVATMLVGLLPILWSTGAGANVMRHVAVPMIGGIVTSFLLELLVYPPLFQAWKRRSLARL